MKLKYVSYMSLQSRLMTRDEMDGMLFQIREKNKRLGITGILLLIQGKFIQYIEGPEEEVDKVYNKIKIDTRHNELLLLDDGYVEERQFKDWSMAFKRIDDRVVEKIVGFKDLELDLLFLEPTDEKKHPVLKILYNFTHMLAS